MEGTNPPGRRSSSSPAATGSQDERQTVIFALLSAQVGSPQLLSSAVSSPAMQHGVGYPGLQCNLLLASSSSLATAPMGRCHSQSGGYTQYAELPGSVVR
ncbi:hypothetical protein MAP00_002707 [Monascus purpureus]|nr:hypothetical protein MAP00_002707 [Monascus purpureus]